MSIASDAACSSDLAAALVAALDAVCIALPELSAATGDLSSPAPDICPVCPDSVAATGDLSSPAPKTVIFLASTCGFAFKVCLMASTSFVVTRDGAP